jgi:hypothetical protein
VGSLGRRAARGDWQPLDFSAPGGSLGWLLLVLYAAWIGQYLGDQALGGYLSGVVSDRVHPSRRMARAIVFAKLAGRESRPPRRPALASGQFNRGGAAMRQLTFRASAVAFVLGLLISLVWSFLHASGF